MKSIKINMEKFSSEVIFTELSIFFEDDTYENALYVCDTNTKRYLPPGQQKNAVILNNGEKYKNWKSIQKILSAALKKNMGRDNYIIGIGGGVITDMTAFAASLYMRGCKVILVPTTVLAMSDAAVGGKTGVDYFKYKNMIGTFYPAHNIIIDINTIITLNDREFLSGFAEILKAALLKGGSLFEFIKMNKDKIISRDTAVLEDLLFQAVSVKADIVEEDLREAGIRGFLNLGHTFGHALETSLNFKYFTHGEAVAWGIARAMDAGIKIGVTDKIYAEEVYSLLNSYGYELGNSKIDSDSVIAAMSKDKKKRKGKIRFILQKNIGNTLYSELDIAVIREVLT